MTRPVLLIDDNDLFRASVVELFRDTEYQITEATSPADAISILDSSPDIHVILLDLSFDDVPGTTVLTHIARCSDQYRAIVLTGHEELLLAGQAANFEVFYYLAKGGTSTGQSIQFAVDQAFKDLERAHLERKSDRLLRIQERIKTNASTAGTLDLICQSVREVVGAYTCHIRVYDFKGGDYHLQGFAGPDTLLRHAFLEPKKKGALFSGRVVSGGAAAVFDDAQRMPDFQVLKQAALAREASPQERDYYSRIASAYVVPISTGLFGHLVDAVLAVSSERRGYFVADRQRGVDEFVTQAALCITKDWLQRKREEAQKDYGDISTMLSEVRDTVDDTLLLDSIYDVVTRRMATIINAEIVSVFRYEPRTGRLSNVAEVRGSDRVVDPREEYNVGQSLTGHVFGDNDTIQLPHPNDLHPDSPPDDPRFDSASSAEVLNIPSGELKHYLGVPIRVGSTVCGVLRAINKRSAYYDNALPSRSGSRLLERGFTYDCRNLMEITASHLGGAIRNAELLQQKDREVERIRTLSEVGRLINSEIHIDELLRVTITKMAEVMQAEICLLFLRDEGDEHLLLKQAFGVPATLIPTASYRIGEGLTGSVAQTRKPIVIGMAANDGKYDSELTSHLSAKRGQRTGIETLMAVPIQARDKNLGVMKVINRVGIPREYDARDLELFQTFADYVGVAIANARIYKHANDRLAIAERNAALSLLVSSVAHEINNTSGVIPANVDSIRAELLTPSENVTRMLDDIEDAANQSTDFAHELAAFAATQAGLRKALNINDIIREAAEALATQEYWDSDTRAVELSLSARPLVCEVYRTPFAQIVRNIVINAFQALGDRKGGRVRVSSEEGRGQFLGSAVIRFKDNGPGIKAEYLTRIFASDFTTKPKGNGLGLWLVRTQLELVGGSIDVESELGHGAQFIVAIPLAAPRREMLQ